MLLLVVSFGIAWPIFQLLLPAYRELLAAGMNLAYRFSGESFEFRAFGEQLVFRSFSPPTFEANLSTRGVAANMVFLWALLLSTPGINLKNRGLKWMVGTLLLFSSHLLFLVIKVEVSLVAAQHPAAGWALLWNGLDNFFEITGKVFFPVLIWVLLALSYMFGSVDVTRPKSERKKPGRNDPCTCGSGKKFKVCCGR